MKVLKLILFLPLLGILLTALLNISFGITGLWVGCLKIGSVYNMLLGRVIIECCSCVSFVLCSESMIDLELVIMVLVVLDWVIKLNVDSSSLSWR